MTTSACPGLLYFGFIEKLTAAFPSRVMGIKSVNAVKEHKITKDKAGLLRKIYI
jgi:hypothetical protein